jgi:ribonuclease HII
VVSGEIMTKTIKEIEEMLFLNAAEKSITAKQIGEFEKDSRKGVQKLLERWRKQQKNEKLAEEKFQQMSQYELELRNNDIGYIAGVDEVGRGPLAGPVVSASVILPEDFYLPGLNDSKAVSEKNREYFYEVIQKKAIAVGIGIVSPEEIDEINIYEATKVAMMRAIEEMDVEPEHLLIDAMQLPLLIPQTSIIKGDANSVSIAASSIIAKVTRDRMMQELDEQFPEYGFKNNMGYGTKEHLVALDAHGVTPAHRKSFAPVREKILT